MTKELRKHLKSIIEKVCNNVSYFDSNANMPFPYITFELRDSSSDFIDKRVMQLEVNAWNENNYSTIEDIIDNLDKLFNRYKHIDEKMFLSIYKGSIRQQIPDENKSIKRIRRIYEVNYYEREV